MMVPEEFLARMKIQLGEQYDAYIRAMNDAPKRALRVNTLKCSVEEFLKISPFPVLPLGHGSFLLQSRENIHIGAHPLHMAGLFYMQEASAMHPARLLDVKPGMRVLDLCAAPGGKAGQLAAALHGRGLLVANEVVPRRAAILQETLVRMGVQNALCTNMKPDILCGLLHESFDAVLVDAPCSGEGMFRKEPEAARAWSKEHVLSCAARQSIILDCAAGALKPGGRLVYSTCTFSREENENVVNAFLLAHRDFSLVTQERIYPHTSQGEGQYMALFIRGGIPQSAYPKAALPAMPRDARRLFDTFWQECMQETFTGTPLLLPDGRVMLLPEDIVACYSRLKLRFAGVYAGDIVTNRFVPAHALSMAYHKSAYACAIELNEAQQREYLRGEALQTQQSWRGYAVACASGHPLGWVKASDGMLKNHLPKGLRIS